ncbi:MAG TPA: tetratricopeptide repeat protein [Candidatus Limnocylindrales bacterium]
MLEKPWNWYAKPATATPKATPCAGSPRPTSNSAGRPGEGLKLALSAVEFARATGDQRLEVGGLNTLARLHQKLRRYDLAVNGYRGAIRIAQEIGNRYLEAEATVGLAESLRHMGDSGGARSSAARALRLSEDGGYPAPAGRARALLADFA